MMRVVESMKIGLMTLERDSQYDADVFYDRRFGAPTLANLNRLLTSKIGDDFSLDDPFSGRCDGMVGHPSLSIKTGLCRCYYIYYVVLGYYRRDIHPCIMMVTCKYNPDTTTARSSEASDGARYSNRDELTGRGRAMEGIININNGTPFGGFVSLSCSTINVSSLRTHARSYYA
jgi:hypothetical protein